MRKTKIVCTLGPATENEGVLLGLMDAGMNVARINFSHSTHSEHKKKIDLLKNTAAKYNKNVAIMLDTKGPEIRIGTFSGGSVTINEGSSFTLTTEDIIGDNTIVSVTYASLPSELKAGDVVLIDDGNLALDVEKTDGKKIVCRAKNTAVISDRKSINIPNVSLKIPYISENDKTDLLFGIENDIDFVAASFVRSADDVKRIKKFLMENGGSDIKVISKIENKEGVENMSEIISASDGVMVARGDLGVEIPFEELPAIQKNIIKTCYRAGKVVITATQMLDSMIRNPRPTRAEVTDVANAIYDGTSAIMLSGETAVGKYPVAACATMAKIAESTEHNIDYTRMFNEMKMEMEYTITNAIGHATCMTAIDLDVAAILTVSNSGATGRSISKFRPEKPIICATPNPKVCRQLGLSWGVVPLLSKEEETTDALFESAVNNAVKNGYIKNGNIIVITGGAPVGVSGTTNIMKVHVVGNVLVKGRGVNKKTAVAPVYVDNDAGDAHKHFKDGHILVVKSTDNDMFDLIKRSKGVIVEEDGLNCHAAIVGMALELPVIVGATNALKILKSGSVVTMDCERGIVYSGGIRIN